MSTSAVTMENSMKGPQKTKHIAAIWSSNPTPGHISRQNCNSKTCAHPCAHSSTVCPSTDEQIKIRYTDTMEYYSAIKKNGIMPFAATQADLPGGASGNGLTYQCKRWKRCRFDPWVRKITWRRKWQPTPVFLPGESYGQWSLVGYGPWGCKELDMTEAT